MLQNRKKRKKSILSCVLAVSVIVVAIFPETISSGSLALAEETSNISKETEVPAVNSWNGTADKSWYTEGKLEFFINTPQQLAGLAELVNEGNTFEGKIIRLTGDIFLNSEMQSTEYEWIPIAYSSDKDDSELAFQGTFDGGGHHIYNIYTSDKGQGGGLFGRIGEQGVVKAVTVSQGYLNCGGSIAYNNDGRILFCSNDSLTEVFGKESSYLGNCGAICNFNSNLVYGCKNYGSVYSASSTSDAAGIVGTNTVSTATVSECSNIGIVQGYKASGIVSYNHGWIQNCYSRGEIMAGRYAAGITYYNYNGIGNCYFAGNLKIGREYGNRGAIYVEDNTARNPENCYAVTADYYCDSPDMLTYEAMVSAEFTDKLNQQVYTTGFKWYLDDYGINNGFPINSADYSIYQGKYKMAPEIWVESVEPEINARLEDAQAIFQYSCSYADKAPDITIDHPEIAEVVNQSTTESIKAVLKLKEAGKAQLTITFSETENNRELEYKIDLTVTGSLVETEGVYALGSSIERQYVDEENGILYTLDNNYILRSLNMEDGSREVVYDFKRPSNSSYGCTYQTDDRLFVSVLIENKYYLYVFNKKSRKLEDFYELENEICAIGADADGNILLSVEEKHEDKNYTVKCISKDREIKSVAYMDRDIKGFNGYDSYGNVYYNIWWNYIYWGYDHDMCGWTYAAWDGDTFAESQDIIRNLYQYGFSFYKNPVTFFNSSLCMDYLGNVCEITEKGIQTKFSVSRDLNQIDFPEGAGCQAAYFSENNTLIARNTEKLLYTYNLSDGTVLGFQDTAYPIYSVYAYGSRLAVIEYTEEGEKYVEILDPQQFNSMETKVLNLNEEECYKNRTKSDIVKRYHNIIGTANLDASTLLAEGVYAAPYKEAVIEPQAYQTLMDFSNYQRWLAGLSDYADGDSETITKTAKGALLLNVADSVGHDPAKPADMSDDFYNDAKMTTSGNISYGRTDTIRAAVSSIRGLADDTANATNQEQTIHVGGYVYHQGYNTPGHRNTFFQRGGNKLSYGIADSVLLQYYEYAQNDPNESGNIEATGNNHAAYAWPAAGEFPSDEIDPKAVWTLYLNTDVLDFGNTSPVITIIDLDTGKEYVRDTQMHEDGPEVGYSWSNFWGKSLSFSPPEADDFAGKNYKVAVENLEAKNGQPTTVEYTIHFFDYTGVFEIDGVTYVCNDDGRLSDMLPGDANGDGEVNSKDAVLLKKHLAGYEGLIFDREAADVNGDNEVDSKDAVRLLRYLAGYGVTLGK